MLSGKESSAEGKWQRPGNRDAFAGKNAEHLGEEVEAENRKEQETLLMAEAEEVEKKEALQKKEELQKKKEIQKKEAEEAEMAGKNPLPAKK